VAHQDVSRLILFTLNTVHFLVNKKTPLLHPIDALRTAHDFFDQCYCFFYFYRSIRVLMWSYFSKNLFLLFQSLSHPYRQAYFRYKNAVSTHKHRLLQLNHNILVLRKKVVSECCFFALKLEWLAWSYVESNIVYLVDFLVVLCYNWLTHDVVPYLLLVV